MYMQRRAQLDHELRFQSLYDPNRGLGFPCDSDGMVNVHALTPHACSRFLLARAAIGREYAQPVVVPRYIHVGPFDS